jgi:hypothetical protein
MLIFLTAVVMTTMLKSSTVHAAAGASKQFPRKDVHFFYYIWYGTPEDDGGWRHWVRNYFSNCALVIVHNSILHVTGPRSTSTLDTCRQQRLSHRRIQTFSPWHDSFAVLSSSQPVFISQSRCHFTTFRRYARGRRNRSRRIVVGSSIEIVFHRHAGRLYG